MIDKILVALNVYNGQSTQAWQQIIPKVTWFFSTIAGYYYCFIEKKEDTFCSIQMTFSKQWPATNYESKLIRSKQCTFRKMEDIKIEANRTVNRYTLAKLENDIAVQERILDTLHTDKAQMMNDMSLVHIYFKESEVIQYSRDQLYSMVDFIGKSFL